MSEALELIENISGARASSRGIGCRLRTQST